MTDSIGKLGDDVVQPLRHVRIKKIKKEEVSKGGIVLAAAEYNKNSICVGEVEYVGDLLKSELKVGDKVLFTDLSLYSYSFEDTDIVLIREADVLALVDEKV